MFNLFNKKGVLLCIVCIVAIVFTCNAQTKYKLDSTTYVKRGVYDMHLSRSGHCVTYPNYRSNTYKKRTIFHSYYTLTKTKKGWKLIQIN